LLICGTKDQYRQLRDMHTLETRIKEVKITVAKGGFDFSDMSGSAVGVSLQYDTLIQLIEQLKTCVEVAESRTLNWQRFCVSDETVLPFLLQVWLESSSLLLFYLIPGVLPAGQRRVPPGAAAAAGGPLSPDRQGPRQVGAGGLLVWHTHVNADVTTQHTRFTFDLLSDRFSLNMETQKSSTVHTLC
jgi:E3 ubiquitin-protein ligase UBR4